MIWFSIFSTFSLHFLPEHLKSFRELVALITQYYGNYDVELFGKDGLFLFYLLVTKQLGRSNFILRQNQEHSLKFF